MPKFSPELANDEKNIKSVFNRNMEKLSGIISNLDATNFARGGIIRKDLIHKDVFRDFVTTDPAGFPYTPNSILVFEDKTGLKAKSGEGFNFGAPTETTEDYTATLEDYIIIMDGSSSTVTVTLPEAPLSGQMYIICCSNDTNTTDIDFNGYDYDGDAGNFELFEDENISIVFTGTEWRTAG